MGCALSGASMPVSLTLWRTFPASRTLIVSPSVTFTTMPVKSAKAEEHRRRLEKKKSSFSIQGMFLVSEVVYAQNPWFKLSFLF